MKRLTLAFGATFALAAAAHAGVSLVAETPENPPGSAAPAVDGPSAKSLDVIGKPFDNTHAADAVVVDSDGDPRCTFKPPAPALVAARYADYRAQRNANEATDSPGDLTESATLADGTRLRVVSYGCVDSTGHTFEFAYAKPKHAANDIAFWAAQARSSLGALALDEHVYGVKELGQWLAHAAALKQHAHKIVQCHDRTQPDDTGCNWESGGSFSLAIEPRGDAVVVTLGVDYSG